MQQPSADPCLTVIHVRQLLLNALTQEWPRSLKHQGQTLHQVHRLDIVLAVTWLIAYAVCWVYIYVHVYDSCRWGLATPPHLIRLVVWLKDVILCLSLSLPELEKSSLNVRCMSM